MRYYCFIWAGSVQLACPLYFGPTSSLTSNMRILMTVCLTSLDLALKKTMGSLDLALEKMMSPSKVLHSQYVTVIINFGGIEVDWKCLDLSMVDMSICICLQNHAL